MGSKPSVLKLPADATQKSEGHPLFGLPDGSVLAVLADPGLDGNPDDSPWAEVAAHLNKRTDPKAVRLTHALHLTTRSAATILFGSRARGSHRPDSDVDIMLVDPRSPRPELDANKLAKHIYGHDITVDIMQTDVQRFAQVERYRNTVATHALLEGLTISPLPSRWRSRYAPPSPAKTVYSWEEYETLAYESKFSLDIALTVHTGRTHGTDLGTEYFLHTIQMAPEQEERESTIDQIVRKNLPESIHKAMQAAVAATGRLPDKYGTVQSLRTTLMEIAPAEEWELSVPAEDYDRMADGEKLDIDRKTLVKKARQDHRRIRRLSATLLRRTKHAAQA